MLRPGQHELGFWSHDPGASAVHGYFGGHMLRGYKERVKSGIFRHSTVDWEWRFPQRDPVQLLLRWRRLEKPHRTLPALKDLAARGSRSVCRASVSTENGVPVRLATLAAPLWAREPVRGVGTTVRAAEDCGPHSRNTSPIRTGPAAERMGKAARTPPLVWEKQHTVQPRPGLCAASLASPLSRALLLALPSLLISFPEPFFLRGPLQESQRWVHPK